MDINSCVRKQMKKFLSLSIFFYLVFASFALANPNCFLVQGNERLTNHCLLETVKGKLVDEQTMQIVVSRLKREGYFGGLVKPSFQGKIFPDVYYSENINGGNPSKKLVVGNLEFDGDPHLIAKKGLVIGLNTSGSARKTIGIGRYLDASANLGYGFSPEHNLSNNSMSLSICSKNRLKDNVHADLCVSAHELNKQISKDRSHSIMAAVSKLSFVDFGAFNEGRLSIIRLNTEDYSQNQLEVTVDAIHPDNLATSLRFKAGQGLTNQLALKYGFGISTTTSISGRKYTLGLSHEYSDGGMLFGVNRSDRSTNISISTHLDATTTISVGYFERDSSINYFDQQYPSIRLTRSFFSN
jgi:hypothetical protein